MTLSVNILLMKLCRVLDSLLNQVDWLKMTIKAAKSWASSIYCAVIEKIMLTQIYHLEKAENEDDIAANSDKSDKKYLYMHTDKNKDDDENESEVLTESEDKSEDSDEDYADKKYENENDNDNEKMSDDKYDKDNEYDSVWKHSCSR